MMHLIYKKGDISTALTELCTKTNICHVVQSQVEFQSSSKFNGPKSKWCLTTVVYLTAEIYRHK